jgi:hypothetical protein
MIRLYEYEPRQREDEHGNITTTLQYRDFQNWLFSQPYDFVWDWNADKVTIYGIEYRISTLQMINDGATANVTCMCAGGSGNTEMRFTVTENTTEEIDVFNPAVHNAVIIEYLVTRDAPPPYGGTRAQTGTVKILNTLIARNFFEINVLGDSDVGVEFSYNSESGKLCVHCDDAYATDANVHFIIIPFKSLRFDVPS